MQTPAADHEQQTDDAPNAPAACFANAPSGRPRPSSCVTHSQRTVLLPRGVTNSYLNQLANRRLKVSREAMRKLAVVFNASRRTLRRGPSSGGPSAMNVNVSTTLAARYSAK